MKLSAPHRIEEVYSMSIQLALRFDEVPITCETQQRYHSISPCLAGRRSAEEQADALGLSYSTVCRWLRKFREEGMPGLFPATQYPREPQTPEHVIVTLLFYKTCAPRASDRELARVLSAITDHRIHNETVKALLERYPLWRYPEFQRLIQYQAPSDPQQLRQEMVKLKLSQLNHLQLSAKLCATWGRALPVACFIFQAVAKDLFEIHSLELRVSL